VIDPIVLQADAIVFGLTASELLVLVIASFAGGAFGAALGALPAFIFTGFMVIAGEAANVLKSELAGAGIVSDPSAISVGITGSIGFGPVFGPHVSFAGGAAAAAYAAHKGYMDTGFDYHESKNIAHALGTKPDVLAVGGAFGIFGMLVRQTSAGLGAPWDPIAMGVVLSALAHRLAFGYSVIGTVRSSSLMDLTPFEREEMRQTAEGGEVVADGSGEPASDGGTAVKQRFAVEPWLPHQYKWSGVAMIGLAVGILGAYIGLATGSYFLGFGISAASLVFLNCGVEQIPVTHHITLPSATAAIIVADGSGLGVSALLAGAAFGILGALLGEVTERIFYAHGDTHWDPPASSIVLTTLLIAILGIVNVFPSAGWVPTP
jgi:hypothetical protein